MESPPLKVGETKMLFTIIPDFEQMTIRDNDINLVVKDDSVKINETEKPNQYLVTVSPTHSTYVEFEIWLDIGNLTILLMENATWIDIRKIYPFKDNRMMIQKIQLTIEK